MKCEKCGQEFSSSEIDNHNLTCSYAFSNKDYEDLIPCEVCSELISFVDYSRHLSICSRPRPIPSNIPIFSFGNFPYLNNIQTNNGNQLENDEELQNNINIINNDPIARSLFSMMIGRLPNNDVTAATTGDSSEALIDAAPAPQEESEENRDTFSASINFENIRESQEENRENAQEYLEFGEGTQTQPIINDLPNTPYNQNILDVLENILNEYHPSNNQNVLENVIPNQNNIMNEDENNYEELINLEDHLVGISDINDVSQLTFEKIECPICSDTKMAKRETTCGHSFCDGCLKEWLKSSKKCPFCMVELE